MSFLSTILKLLAGGKVFVPDKLFHCVFYFLKDHGFEFTTKGLDSGFLFEIIKEGIL